MKTRSRRLAGAALAAILLSTTGAAGQEDPPREFRHAAECPEICAACDGALENALRYLADNLYRKPKAKGLPGMVNAGGAGMRTVSLALASYAFLLGKDDEEHAKQAARALKRLEKASKYLAAQRAWTWGFSGFPYAELAARGKDVDPESVALLIKRIARGQNREGGWGHSEKGDPMAGVFDKMMAMYPSTLIAATNWCAASLGLLQRLGYEVDEEVLRRTVRLLEEVQSHNGALPYGGRTYRKGYEAGRTAATILALHAMGLDSSSMCDKASDYVRRHVKEIPFGHADPGMHILAGAMASHLLGAKDWVRYRDRWVDEILRHQKEDGSFSCIVPDCPTCGETMMADERTSTIYTTAYYACVLGAGRSRALKLLRRSPTPLWKTDAGAFDRLTSCGDRLYAVPSGGASCVAIDAATGKEVWKTDSLWKAEEGEAASVVALEEHKGNVLVAVTLFTGDPHNIVIGPGRRKQSTRSLLICLDASDGSKRWECPVQKAGMMGITGLRCSGEFAFGLSSDGGLRAIELATGREAWKTRVRKTTIFINGGLTVGPDATSFVSIEDHFAAIQPSGEKAWNVAAARTESAATFSRPAVLGGRVVAAESNGTVHCWAASDGAELWTSTIRTGADACVADPSVPDRVFVNSFDGEVRCLRLEDGKILWSFRPPLTGETHEGAAVRSRAHDGLLWVHSRADGELYGLDAEAGRVRSRVSVDGATAWTTSGRRVFLGGGNTLAAYELPKP